MVYSAASGLPHNASSICLLVIIFTLMGDPVGWSHVDVLIDKVDYLATGNYLHSLILSAHRCLVEGQINL